MAPRGLLTRSATVDDAGAVARVQVRGWQVGYRDLLPAQFLADLSAPVSVESRTTTWEGWLAGGAEVVLAVGAGDQVLAFCSHGRSRDEGAVGSTGELYGMYADPDAWGTGAGAAAHDEAVRRLVARGFRRATLWVLERNARGRRFYERQGWLLDTSPGSRKTEEIGGADLVEVRYRRDLVDGRTVLTCGR